MLAVIVNWNSATDTLECVQSLRAAGAELSQILVVDNGSSDDSVQALTAEFGPELLQIENDKNLGFAAGSNLGIRDGLARAVEWILLINNDTVVHPDFLSALHRAAQADFDVLGPMIYFFDAPDTIWYLADTSRFAGLVTTNPYVGRKAAELSIPPGPFPIEFICGTAMLVRSAVFEQVGLLDESLFMYAEEVDFTLRARAAGFRFGAEPRARMWHRVSVSADRVAAQSRYLRIRNQIWIYRRHSKGWITLMLLGFTTARTLAMLTMDLLRGRLSLVRSAGRGWVHGWTKPVGDPAY
jgi:hypothetical protein